MQNHAYLLKHKYIYIVYVCHNWYLLEFFRPTIIPFHTMEQTVTQQIPDLSERTYYELIPYTAESKKYFEAGIESFHVMYFRFSQM